MGSLLALLMESVVYDECPNQAPACPPPLPLSLISNGRQQPLQSPSRPEPKSQERAARRQGAGTRVKRRGFAVKGA